MSYCFIPNSIHIFSPISHAVVWHEHLAPDTTACNHNHAFVEPGQLFGQAVVSTLHVEFVTWPIRSLTTSHVCVCACLYDFQRSCVVFDKVEQELEVRGSRQPVRDEARYEHPCSRGSIADLGFGGEATGGQKLLRIEARA